MIYFTSDTHYNHTNLVKGVSTWESKEECRNFNDVDEMNNTIVDNINKVVLKNDTLYHLGDWSFGNRNNIWVLRKRLNCDNIHLILGNHDEEIEECEDAKHLFDSVSHYKEIKINKQRIILCHYAMRVWNKSHRGSWMLYGHSHGTLDDKKAKFPEPTWIGENYYIKNSKSMDVGIDCHKDFRPFSFSELTDIMAKKEILLNIDHHGKR